MSRFTTVNPFLSEAQDPDTVYYNGQIMCKDNTLPLAKYVDAQDVPILKDVGKFSVLLTQLEMNNVTNNLPIYETKYANFTKTIALIKNNGNFSTIFCGYEWTNGGWYSSFHRMTELTLFNISLS